MRFVSEEQNYFCLKSEIKNVSKYGKVMLTWAVISIKQQISSFLVMLHLTVFCLNQLWRAARTWKFLRWDGHSTRCVFSILSMPLCPPALILLHCSLTSAFHAILQGLLGTREGMRDRNDYLQSRIFICILRTEFPVQCCFLTSGFFFSCEFIYSGRSWVASWLKNLKFAMHSR